MKYTEKDFTIIQDFDVLSLDYSKGNEHIVGINHLAFATRKCVFIFDYYKHNFFYIKTYNKYLNNIPEIVEKPYSLYNSNIHPEDLDYVYKIHHRAFSFVFSLSVEKRKDLLLHYNCRFKNNTGNYEMTDISIKLIETDSKGCIWLVLFVLDKSKNVYFEIPYIETATDNQRYQFDFNYNLLEKLTSTEKELLFMMFENISDKEIANFMKISYNTLRSHLRNIRKKTGFEDRFGLLKEILS